MRANLLVQFAKLDSEALVPTKGSAQAAGWDLYALEEVVVKRNISSMIRTGLAIAIRRRLGRADKMQIVFRQKRIDYAQWYRYY